MAITNFYNTLNTSRNFNVAYSDTKDNIEPENFFWNIITLGEDNGSNVFLKDDIDILYGRQKNNNDSFWQSYTDSEGKTGYQSIFNFQNDEFAGTIKSVALAPSFFSKNKANEANRKQTMPAVFNVTDILTKNTRVLDVDYENGYFTTFGISLIDGEWTCTIAKWNHDFQNFRIGGALSYFFLKEVTSIDVNDFMSLPDGAGGLIPLESESDACLIKYGIDEKNNKIVLVFLEETEKVINTLSFDRNDYTQTELHNMILPNEVDFNEYYPFGSLANGNAMQYAAFYKGRFCDLLYVTRLATEEEINGVVMCSINYKNSTDIKSLETHYFQTREETTEISFANNIIQRIKQPLYNSDCGSFISDCWCIKNEKANVYRYTGLEGGWGFYNNGFMVSTDLSYDSINNKINANFVWNICPYCLTIIERLQKPFIKTLNRPLKYTFRLMKGY